MDSFDNVLIILTVFVATIAFIVALYLLWSELHQAGSENIKRRVRLFSAAAVQEKAALKQVSLAREQVISPLDHALLSLPRLHHLDRFLVQAGVGYGPALSLSLTLAVGILGLVAAVVLVQSFQIFPLILGFSSGACLPWLWLNRRRQKRRQRMIKQLPDAMDFVARTLRAGIPFVATLKSASEEMPQPLADELGITFEEMNYGLDFEDAMHNLAARVDAEEVRFFVTAILVQKTTGGNLAEILNRISALLRERIRAKGEVNIQAAEMRTSARILIALPFIVAGLVQLFNPEYLPVLFDTRLGEILVTIQLALMLSGYLIMRHMINFRI